MKTTITCPTCGLEHGLFWRVSSPYKEDWTLSYRCNRVQKQVQVPGNFNSPEYHSFTETRSVTDQTILAEASALKLPEEYTAAYRKEVQDKAQQQLILMYPK